MQFDKQSLRSLRPQIEAALKSIEKELKVKFSLGSCRFTSENATFKLEVATVSKGGKVASVEATAFKEFASLYNLKPSDLGRSFTSFSGQSFTIIGLNTRKSKYPIIAKDNRDRRFKFSSESVVTALRTANR